MSRNSTLAMKAGSPSALGLAPPPLELAIRMVLVGLIGLLFLDLSKI
jgi:hypothetical protein